MTNMEYLQESLSEMKRYERNWNFMSRQERRDIGCTKKELQRRIRKTEIELILERCEAAKGTEYWNDKLEESEQLYRKMIEQYR